MRFSTYFSALCLATCMNPGASAEDRMDDGREAYLAYCANCHDTGKMDAPVTRNRKDWTGRSDLWESVLFEHADKGYVDMPARGGNPEASDYQVKAAAEYMLTVTQQEMPAD